MGALVAAAATVAAGVVAVQAPPAIGVAAAATAGATTPFVSLEAESGTLSGGATTVSLTAAPTTQYSSAALEASGHSYAHLSGPGQSVQWTNTTGQPITALAVRESIPDSPSGGGMTATLNLYVNGAFRQALSLSSKQTWVYEGNNHYNDSSDQNPADGNPRVFFDEVRTFVTGAAITPGSTFALRKDSDNTAQFYDIDVVDVENPPRPLSQPARPLASNVRRRTGGGSSSARSTAVSGGNLSCSRQGPASSTRSVSAAGRWQRSSACPCGASVRLGIRPPFVDPSGRPRRLGSQRRMKSTCVVPSRRIRWGLEVLQHADHEPQ